MTVGATWVGDIRPTTGFGEEVYRVVHGLRQLGVDAWVWDAYDSLHPGMVAEAESRYGNIFSSKVNGRTVVMHEPAIASWREGRLGRTSGVKAIWRAAFETARIPSTWLELADAVDEVWVPSKFNIDSFVGSGVDSRKLVRIPPPIDLNWPQRVDAARQSGRRIDGRFTFLAVGTWQYRKGWDTLVRAFLTEFKWNEDVRLIVKTRPMFGPSVTQASRRIIEQVASWKRTWGSPLGKAPDMRLMLSDIAGSRMPNLFSAADAFVLATRGEGWGMPFMEAMAAGIPVIGTGWGGHCDYMNQRNSFLVDFRVCPVPQKALEEFPYFEGQVWAEPSLSDLRRALRLVYEGGQEVERRRDRARRDVLSAYGIDAVAARVSARLDWSP